MVTALNIVLVVWYRSGHSNVNVSQSNTNNIEDSDDVDEQTAAPTIPPPGRFKVDTQRSIGNVRKRVSVLAGGGGGTGTVDRSALLRSVLASRSLLERSGDVDRLLDGVKASFQTSMDNRFRPGNQPALNTTESFSRRREERPNLDRFSARSGAIIPARQTSSANVVAWADSIKVIKA